MPKLRHYDNLGTARFITFSCFKRHPYLSDRTIIEKLLPQIITIRDDNGVKIYGYVIMPEHVHLVLHPPEGTRLGLLIGQMKARASYAIITPEREILKRSNGQPAIWQRRCYDNNCRKPEIVREKINYCHNNPVVRRLVSSPGDWPWSSYRWYQGDRDVPISIDGFEL